MNSRPANDNEVEHCDGNGFVFTSEMSKEAICTAKKWSREVTKSKRRFSNG